MRPSTLRVACSAVLLLVPLALFAQGARPVPTRDTLPRPAAAPADVASPDAILGALYDVISGPAGRPRDWDRFRSLFVPNARLIPARPRPGGAGAEAIVWSADDYVAIAAAGLERSGFFEREIHRTTEGFGAVLHAFSTYESRRTADLSEKPFARGINSIQLLRDGGRWWVVTVFWDAERTGNEIPAKYLPR